jgi:hypothetical protein
MAESASFRKVPGFAVVGQFEKEKEMKLIWLNESLVFRGESPEEKRALNVVYGALRGDVSELEELQVCDAIDSLDAVPIANISDQ